MRLILDCFLDYLAKLNWLQSIFQSWFHGKTEKNPMQFPLLKTLQALTKKNWNETYELLQIFWGCLGRNAIMKCLQIRKHCLYFKLQYKSVKFF